QHREREALLLRPHALRVLGVARDRQHLCPRPLERRRVVADLAELSLAHAGEGERIEHDHDRLAPQLRERDLVAVPVLQREAGGGVAGCDHGASPFVGSTPSWARPKLVDVPRAPSGPTARRSALLRGDLATTCRRLCPSPRGTVAATTTRAAITPWRHDQYRT